MLRVRPLLTALLLLSFVGVPLPLWAAIDSSLYTSYYTQYSTTQLFWIVCGSTQQTTGCYGGGGLGPFGRVGALLEGNPSTNLTKNTVTRFIYVLDIGYGSSSDGVALYVYKKVDTITPDNDLVTVTLFKTVPLPLKAGSSALAYMAANSKFLFIGTDQSPHPIQVKKNTLAVVQLPEFWPGLTVSAITADKYGYVTVTFGKFSGSGGNGSLQFKPDGSLTGFGGSPFFMLNTMQAVLPPLFP